MESVWIGLEGVEDIDVVDVGKLGEGYFTAGLYDELDISRVPEDLLKGYSARLPGDCPPHGASVASAEAKPRPAG